MTEMIPWEQVRAEALESGRVTQDAITRVKIEQDAHVAGSRLAELRGKTEDDPDPGRHRRHPPVAW